MSKCLVNDSSNLISRAYVMGRESAPAWATGAAVLWASTALAQSYTGDVAIEEDSVAFGQKCYSPYFDQP